VRERGRERDQGARTGGAIIGEVVRLRERLAWFEARARDLETLMAEAL